MDLLVRVEKDGVVDREITIYKTVLEDIKKYFANKYLNKSKFLPIPQYVMIDERSIFILDNMRHLGYKGDLLKNREGLNVEHAVLVVAALAKFHAASYCFRKETSTSLEHFSKLKQPLTIPKLDKGTMEILEQILKAFPDHGKYSINFLDLATLENLNTNLNCFGVLCHGHLCRENLLFRYKSNLEYHLSCSDVLHQDFSSSHYGS